MTTEPKTSQELIEENQRLVHALAHRIHRRLPHHIPLEDIICYGQLGLAQAARSFQHEHGSKFTTFAYYRIRGAIFDGLTKMNWTSRSAYQRMKAEQMANEVLDPSDTGKEDRTDPELEAKWLAQSSERLAVVYLASGAAADESQPMDFVDEKSQTPDTIAANSELHEVLNKTVDSLPEPGKSLIRFAYFENMSLAEAAEQLGKSRSWACRLHSKILTQLAQTLNAPALE